MTQEDSTVTSTNLDHHGLVATICRDLNIAGRINDRIGSTDPRRIVQPGVAVEAMLINGLGFTNRRLYLTPQFFESKPIDRLFGEQHITAEQLDDHALGKALDEIADYGPTKLFGELAFDIAQERKLLGPAAHIDTTTFSVHGQYTENLDTIAKIPNDNETPSGEPEIVRITHGYSKDHRPDLKQIILSLTMTGDANIPIWMEPLSGNASDKVTFQETIARIRAFQSQLKDNFDFLWIGDSALYVPKKLLSHDNVRWITRVPETIRICKDLVSQNDDALTWNASGDDYKYVEVCNAYGGIKQRWILVHSAHAYEREKNTFLKNLIKQDDSLKKTCKRLGNKKFTSIDDARAALSSTKKKYRNHTIESDIVEEKTYARRGRPQTNDKHDGIRYRMKITLCTRNEEACALYLRRKGRFVLATNDLNSESLTARDILVQYKSQQKVEGGFRFLKDPWFMIDSFFLKSTRRITALMMVMTLCLLVYNIAQYTLRKALHDTKETIPNQLNKATAKPTMRWVFQIMEGISVVKIGDTTKAGIRCIITNLDELRMKIIRLFGRTACLIYGIP